MNKRALSLFLAAVLLITMLPQAAGPVLAEEPKAEPVPAAAPVAEIAEDYTDPVESTDEGEYVYGSCGDGLYWRLYLYDGELEIYGSGPMYDYEFYADGSTDAPWYEWRSSVHSVSMFGLSSVGSAAFASMYLTEIELPDTVTSIGNRAFLLCQSLVKLTIPSSVVTIHDESGDGYNHLGSGFAIYGWPDSYAESFAADNDIPFVCIGDCEDGIHNYQLVEEQYHSATEDGWRKYRCANCGDEYTEIIPAGHVYTCVAQGEYWNGTMQCVYCDDSYEGDCSLELTLDVEQEVVIPNGFTTAWLRFTPEESGRYALTSLGSQDSYCELYDQYRQYLFSDDDSGSNMNFLLKYDLNAGESYYFRVCFYSNYTGSFPVLLTNYVPPTSGSCGDNLTWSFDPETGLLTLEGSGDMWYYGADPIPWAEWKPEITAVSLPEGLTSLGNYVFEYCTQLTQIELPESLEYIGMWSLSNTGLTSLNIPANVRSIEFSALEYLNACTGFFVDPDNEYYSSDEKGVLYTKDQTALIKAPGAISGSCTLPDTVQYIELCAFQNCSSLEQVILPEGLLSISWKSFYGCVSLSGIELPESLISIDEYAFGMCDCMQEIYIPKHVEILHENAFLNESGHMRIFVDEANPYYCSDAAGVVYNKDMSCLCIAPYDLTGTFYMPATVTELSSYAFRRCMNLTAIELPDGLETVGDQVFNECHGLSELSFPMSVTYIGYAPSIDCSSLQRVTVMNPNCVLKGMNWHDAGFGFTNQVTLRGGARSTIREYAELCGYAFEKLVLCSYGYHDYQLTDQQDHTETEPGWKQYRCVDCGEEYTEDIPAGHDFCELLDSNLWLKTYRCRYCDEEQTVDVSVPIEADHSYTAYVTDEEPEAWYRFSSTENGGYRIQSFSDIDTCVELYGEDRTFLDDDDDSGDDCNFLLDRHIDAGETVYFLVRTYGYGAGTIPFTFTKQKMCGDTLSWSFDEETGTLSITGFGRMYDYEPGTAPWYPYADQIRSLDCTRSMYSIGRYAFYGCTALTEVMINSNWFFKIGCGAFKNCVNLRAVKILNCYPTIEESTEDVVYDGDDTYEDLPAPELSPDAAYTLGVPGTTVVYASSGTDVQRYADTYGYRFMMIGSLNGNVIWTLDPESGKLVVSGTGSTPDYDADDGAFGYVAHMVTELEIEEGLTGLGDALFRGLPNLKEVTIPASVQKIGYACFKDCESLKKVTILNPRCVVQTETWIIGDDSEEDLVSDYAAYALGVPGRTTVYVEFETPAYAYAVTYGYTVRDLLRFCDVSYGDYFYSAVRWAVAKGITAGTTETTFSPYRVCTRAQIMTFLWRAMGSPEPENGCGFTDVSEDDYFYKPVCWALENGITAGSSAITFSPNQVCTRAAAVTFLWRAYGCVVIDAPLSFTDVPAGAFYARAVVWAQESGITSGTGDGLFSPNQVCTRAQVVTFLFQAKNKGWINYDGYVSQLDSSGSYVRADDFEIYQDAFAEFNFYMEQAAAAQTESERILLCAQAEAALLDSAIVMPLNTRGGNYMISRIAPRTTAHVMFGNDADRRHRLVISGDLLTTEEHDALEAQWRSAVAGQGSYDPAAYLTAQGHSLQTSLRVPGSNSLTTLDWVGTTYSAESSVLTNLVDGLVEYDNLGNLQPALAESWEISADGLTYTFHIREGVCWYTADGDEYAELSANDFVAGFRHMLDCRAGLESLAFGIAGADEYVYEGAAFENVGYRALDDHTLQITLESRSLSFLSLLTYNLFRPICASFYLAHGGVYGEEALQAARDNGSYSFASADVNSQVYCGPFLLQSITSQEIRCVKNLNYYAADSVTLESLAWVETDYDPMSDYERTLNGEFASITLWFANGTLDAAKADGSFALYAFRGNTNSTTYMSNLNLNRGTFALESGAAASSKTEQEKADTATAMNNRNFRKALLYAFDRTSYNAIGNGEDSADYNLRNMLTPPEFAKLDAAVTDADGHSFSAGSFFGELVQYYCDQRGCGIDCRDGRDGWYDPDAAQSCMEAARAELGAFVSFPIQIDLICYTASDVQVERAFAVKDSLEETLGTENVTVNLISVDNASDFYACSYMAGSGEEMNYDLFSGSGWGPDYGDAASYLDIFYYTDGCFLKNAGLF